MYRLKKCHLQANQIQNHKIQMLYPIVFILPVHNISSFVYKLTTKIVPNSGVKSIKEEDIPNTSLLFPFSLIDTLQD